VSSPSVVCRPDRDGSCHRAARLALSQVSLGLHADHLGEGGYCLDRMSGSTGDWEIYVAPNRVERLHEFECHKCQRGN
jgi:hypothetical protein